MSMLASWMSLAFNRKRIFLILACQLAFWMAVLPVQAEDLTPETETTGESGQVITSAPEEEPACALGTASYYAKRFKGRKTSSGERYDPKKLTAAHPTLPFGTQVKVVNPANNRSVIVTINDRCRKRDESFIDLSRQAARELGILRQGKATVLIIPLEEDNPSEDDDPSPEVPDSTG